MGGVTIHASFGNGVTLGQFANIIQQRMQYMRETARESIAACALQALRSIRTITLVAKPSRIKVNLDRNNSLCLSYTTQGRQRQVCLRVKGSNVRYTGPERLILAERVSKGAQKLWQVYEFVDEMSKRPTKRLIAAPNLKSARDCAKRIVAKRLMRYAGLAKRALSILMQKTYNKNVADNVAPRVTRKAYEVTRKSEVVQENKSTEGGTYTLTLYDNLMYARDAIRGGQGAVDNQMKKAMNKIVSVINHKIPDADTFFGPRKLPTPFPELVRRKK